MIPSRCRPFHSWFPEEEMSIYMELSSEMRGVWLTMRDYSWTHEGIPADPEELQQLLKNLCQISRYKLKKHWESFETFFAKFFTKIDARFYYSRDEEKRQQVYEISDKRSESGKLGAKVRWQNRYENPSDAEILASSEKWQMPSNNNHTDIEIERERKPPPPPPASEENPEVEVEEEASSPPKFSNTSEPEPEVSPPRSSEHVARNQPLTTSEYQAFVTHAASVVGPDYSRGVGTPSRRLCERIRAKFPELPVNEELFKRLPKFPNQASAGLWGSPHVTREMLECEALRQDYEKQNPARKPTERDLSNQRLKAWAEKRDRERKAGTA